MLTVTFTELRNGAKKYFDKVEKGETIEVYRNGKPVAILQPVRKRPKGRWLRASPLRLSQISLSQLIVEDRELE